MCSYSCQANHDLQAFITCLEAILSKGILLPDTEYKNKLIFLHNRLLF